MDSEQQATAAQPEGEAGLRSKDGLECARILKDIMGQISTPCYENDPPDRQHPQHITMFNGDIRAARRLISKLEDAGAL